MSNAGNAKLRTFSIQHSAFGIDTGGRRAAVLLGAFGIPRGDVALARPGLHSGLLQLHFELVHLAVEDGGGEAEHVLAVELLGNAGEGRAELVLLLQQVEPAAGLLRQLLEAAIRRRALPLAARTDLGD